MDPSIHLPCILFHRAQQKLNLNGGSPHRRRRSPGGGDDDVSSGNSFSQALARSPPAPPPALLRKIGAKEATGVGKVCKKITMLRSHQFDNIQIFPL